MIQFKVDEKAKRCQISWTDHYSKLYLHIDPVKPAKRIRDGELEIFADEGKGISCIELFKTKSSQNIIIPDLLWNTYRFSLREGKDPDSREIAFEEKYVGEKAVLRAFREPCKDSIIRAVLKCEYRIPEKLFWLELAYGSRMGERFYFPPMQAAENGYCTSCLLMNKVCDNKIMRIGFDDRISDYVAVAGNLF